MKYFAILLCAVLGLAGCSTNPVTTMQRVAVKLRMDEGTCSGTLVGKHAILTAEHCMAETKTLLVNGSQVHIRRIILDHHDHALVVVDMEFSRWAFVGDAPTQGDPVFVLGNPGDLSRIFRSGVDAGAYSQGGQYIEFYDINGFFGDSGAGVFNSRGQLVAVVSMMFQQVGNGYMKLMGSFPLAFTDEQWHEAERG